MRKIITAALAGTVLTLAGVGQTTIAQAGDRGFIVVNTNAERSIQTVWTALAGERADPWAVADVDSAIAPNTNSTFTMSGSNCLYDVKVQYSDGYVLTFDNVNVCRMDRVIGT